MREFNTREKKIIKNISIIKAGELRTFSNFLQENCFSLKDGTVFIFLPSQQIAILYIKSSFNDSEVRKKISEFLELISLTEYLRSERYIYSFQFACAQGLNVMCKDFNKISQTPNKDINLNANYHIKPSDAGNIYDKNNAIKFKGFSFKKGESSIYDIMEKNLTSPFSPTEELKQFVKQGFKDNAQIKHEQTLFYSKLAIGVAFIFSFISIVISIWNTLISIYK